MFVFWKTHFKQENANWSKPFAETLVKTYLDECRVWDRKETGGTHRSIANNAIVRGKGGLCSCFPKPQSGVSHTSALTRVLARQWSQKILEASVLLWCKMKLNAETLHFFVIQDPSFLTSPAHIHKKWNLGDSKWFHLDHLIFFQLRLSNALWITFVFL